MRERFLIEKVMMAVAGVCLILLQAACGGGGGPAAPSAASPGPSPSPAVLGPIDSALVGTWTGTVNGSFGPGALTMNLNADATASVEGTGQYCAVVGNWGVSGTEITAKGGDCTGTVVTFVAPVSSTTLAGKWTASSARHGTFSVTR